METLTSHLVSGTFSDRDSADRAYAALQKRGYTKEQIHLFMSDETRRKHFGHDVIKSGTKTMEGTGTGAVIGGGLGAIAATIAAVGSNLVVPGLGLVIAGPLVAALAGAGAGGVTGGVLGALIGTGIPKERAIIIEQGLSAGHIVLGVHTHTDEEAAEVEAELRRFNAHDIHH